MTDLASPAPSAALREARLTQGPVLPVLLSLALPNMLAMVAAASVSVAETLYVGRLGREPLAAMAVVFPFVMLMQNLSSGAMGGGVSSAISRALGAGNEAAARSLALHATAIGLAAGLAFTALFLLAGPLFYTALGARGAVLGEALRYGNTLFCGSVLIWLANTFISILRGGGNTRLPSLAILATVAMQIALGAAFGLGVGPFPRWGMAGVAIGQVLAYGVCAAALAAHLVSARSRVRLGWRDITLQREPFMQILRVGLLACLSPLQTVLTVLVLTALIARLGVDALAGYGIGARLEFLLIPIAFGVGVATVPMVGMAIGRHDVARARRVAWVGGALSAGIVGAIGAMVCLWPGLWARQFTGEPGVIAVAEQYLRCAGPGYAFFGLGLTLFFASQGAGKVLGPVLGGTVRLAIVCLGGWGLVAGDAPAWAYFALVSLSMLAYGVFNAFIVWRADWRQRSPHPDAAR
jgi:putative MATE family efflux protein